MTNDDELFEAFGPFTCVTLCSINVNDNEPCFQ